MTKTAQTEMPRSRGGLWLGGLVFGAFSFLALAVPAPAQDRQVNQLQRSLELVGFDPGPIDGLWGGKTARALNALTPDNSVSAFDDVSHVHQQALLDAFNATWEARETDAAHLQRAMTLADARHLLERTGFGAHPAEIEALVGLPRSQAVSLVVSQLDVRDPILDQPDWLNGPYVNYSQRWDYENEERQAFEIARDKEMGAFRLWWVREMLSTDRTAGERLLLLWHNIFVTQYSTLEQEPLALANQHNTFRAYSASNFRLILQELVRDAAMLNYLDNNNNTKEGPNENLARELMELFVLGEGNYSETDVKEVARALSGNDYSTLRGFEFRFSDWAHDEGTKTILGQRGRFDADDVIDVLLDQPAAAEYITQRFWRAYVSEFHDDPAERAAIAAAWRESDYDIKTLARLTWTTPAFWDEDNRGTIIKSPVDLVLGTIRTSGRLPAWWQSSPSRLRELGQHLFEAPNVAGWPGGPAWITPSRLQTRMMLLDAFKSSEVFEPKPTMTAGEMMMAETDATPSFVQVRYAAEDFEGPPAFFVVGRAAIDGRDRAVWRSGSQIAEGGWDSGKFGRVMDGSDLNWQTATIPFASDKGTPDSFVLFFSNDHCCGQGGSEGGDRNLFIDWIRFGNQVYPATEGTQNTCPNGNDMPGRMYCSGTLTLSQSVSLQTEEAEEPSAGLIVERVSFDGVSENRTDDIRFELSNLRFEDLHIDALEVELFRPRWNGSRGYTLSLRDNRCYPDCFADGWPAGTRVWDNGVRVVEFPLTDRSDTQNERQYANLSNQERRLIGALWHAMPALYEASQQGRNWRRRHYDGIEEDWDPVFERIAQQLPQTRYKSVEGEPPLTLAAFDEQSAAMGMMMSSESSSDIAFLYGLPADPDWQSTTTGYLNQDAGARFLSTSAGDESWDGFGALVLDPRFQLK